MHEEERIRELEASLSILRTRGWVQGVLYSERDGRVCAMGANRVSLGLAKHQYNHETDADLELYRVLPLSYKLISRSIQLVAAVVGSDRDWSKVGIITLYNDVPWRRQIGVERLYRRAIRRLVWQKRRHDLFNKLFRKAPKPEQLPTVTIPLAEWLDVGSLEGWPKADIPTFHGECHPLTPMSRDETDAAVEALEHEVIEAK